MNSNSLQNAFTKTLRLFFIPTLIAGWGAFSGASPGWASTTVSIVDTLGVATPVTQFSVFGSGGQAVESDQFSGPEFTLTQPTVLTEIGGFINCDVYAGMCQPATLPFTVQIRPSTNGAPDASTVLASFVLSDDGDPLVVSYESVAINLPLQPGTYFALFVPQGNDLGFLLGGANHPFSYQAGTTTLGNLDSTTGATSISTVPGAVRILGEPEDVCGNGIVEGTEQCDFGSAINGQPGVCCTATCTFVVDGTPCNDGLRPPAVDGSVQDGPDCSGDSVRDGVPDCTSHNAVQVLNNPRVEDRGVIEFRLTGLPQFIFNATLVLPVYASNGPFPFTVDVLSDTGDGVLNRSDWAKGSRFASFSYSGEQVVTLDVTSIIASALAAGDPFVEFNFRVPVPSDIELNGPFVAFGALALPPAAFLMINEPSRLVSIDIKPGSDTNPINPGSHGEVSVAILGTSDFDATTVNSATVRFGATGTESAPLLVTVEDVNDDARADLLLHFNTQETGIRCRDVSASLTGETFDGQSIQGSDSVRTVGCK